MLNQEPILALVSRAIEGAGFEVVQVKIDARRNVRVWVDREVGGVAVHDCTTLSRRLRDVFEADGLDPGSFQFEVLSPGLDRLLVRERDFARFTGKQVSVRLAIKRGDRRQFKGTLVGFDGGLVRVTEGSETFAFDLRREVDEVRLVPEVFGFPTAAELSQRREQHDRHRPKRKKKRRKK